MKQRVRMKRVSERAYRRSRHGPVCRAKRVPRVVHKPKDGHLVVKAATAYRPNKRALRRMRDWNNRLSLIAAGFNKSYPVTINITEVKRGYL